MMKMIHYYVCMYHRITVRTDEILYVKVQKVKSAIAANHPDWFAEPYTAAVRQ